MSTSLDIVQASKNLVFFKCQHDPLQSFRKSAMAQTSKYFELLWWWYVKYERRHGGWVQLRFQSCFGISSPKNHVDSRLGSFASGLPGISSLWTICFFPEANCCGLVTRRITPFFEVRMTSLTLIEGDILPLCVSEGGYSLSSRHLQGIISAFMGESFSSFARFQEKSSLFSRRNKCLKCACASMLKAAVLRPWGL